MKTEIIGAELQKFNVADSVITEMAAQFLPLKIEGLEDKEGYKTVHKARMIVKGKRIEVEKTRKELNQDAQEFIKAVNGEAKRITNLLLPIETHLETEEARIDEEEAKIQLAIEEKIQVKLEERIQILVGLGAKFNGIFYMGYGMKVDVPGLREMSDSDFGLIHGSFKEHFDHEQAEIARVEAARFEREQAFERQQAEQLKAFEEMQAEKAKIEAEKKKLEEEKLALERAKQKEIEDRLHREELERAKVEAAEKARVEAEERFKREKAAEEAARIKAEEEAKAKAEAEALRIAAELEEKRQKELARPDVEKLSLYIDAISAVPVPDVTSTKGILIARDIASRLTKFADQSFHEINKLK